MMEWYHALLLVTGILGTLLIMGLWIPIAIGATGLIVIAYTHGGIPIGIVGTAVFNSVNSFTLTAVPMFVLMGELVLVSGLMTKFYKSLSLWMRWLPGGLAHTTIAATSTMAAVTGSSVATAGAVGSVAIPELKRAGYQPRLIYGSIAAGGSLGILIPPSIIMIVYGSVTQQSVSALFVAGILPGVLLALSFSAYIALAPRKSVRTAALDDLGDVTWGERIRSLIDVLPIVTLLVGVIYIIYGGFTTPTEAGSLGVVFTLLLLAAYKRLTLQNLTNALMHTIRLSAMVLFIVAGAGIFTYAIVSVRLNSALSAFVVSLGLSQYALLVVISIVIVVLGMFIDGISIIYLALPLLLPIVAAQGFDLIWFGIFVTILIELGQITPPMGLNLFVIKSIDRSASLLDIVRGALPFMFLIVGMLVILTLIPSLPLYLVPSGLK